MKLSALLISYYLQKQYEMTASLWLSSEPHLKYPVYYEGQNVIEDGLIYVINNPDFIPPTHRLSKVFLVFTGNQFDVSVAEYPNVCILPAFALSGQVFTYLQEIFSLYEDWNQSLFESRLKNSSVQHLLNLTDHIIPNPMTVIGMDFTIVAAKKTSYGELKNSVLGSNEETRALVNSMKQDANYTEAYNRTGYFFYPGNDVAEPQLCVNITKFDKTVYRLMTSIGEIPLDDTFGFLLEYLARMISHALSTNTVSLRDSAYSLHHIFQNLLTNSGADYVDISQQISAAGWTSACHYQCILIKTGILDFKNLTLRSICSYVENSIPASCAIEHQDNVVVYINLDLCSLTTDTISQKLASFIRDSLLNAGYSRSMLGHFNFHRQYIQASIALQVGKRVNPSQWIHYFDQIALSYILEQITKKLPAYMVGHEKLLELKHADDVNHTQLYPTVRCYLENQQNITRTAEALFIHRSTLLYRLKKIKEVLKTDFSDPDELLYMLLSFHLIALDEA